MSIESAPRRRSWVDVAISLVDRLPGPPWLFYALLGIVLGLCAILLRWLDGSVAFPTFNPVTVAFAALSTYPFAVMHYLNRAARNSLVQYRPALGAIEPRYAEFERRLTSMPFGLALVAFVVGAAVQAIGLAGSGGGWGVNEHTAWYTTVVALLSQLLVDIGFVAYVLRAIGQLRTIVEIHRGSTSIQLWERAPHDAFSRFTFATAVSIAVPFALVEVLAAVVSSVTVFELVLLVVLLLVSVALFVLPLNGMHARLVAEKARQVAESDRAFEATAARLHDEVGANDLTRAGALNDAMSALVVENDRLKRISTWPWSAETLRGFVTSVGLPILLWLVTTVLGRFFDAP